MPSSFLYRDPEQLLTRFCRKHPEVIPLHVAENILLFESLDRIFRASCSTEVDDIKYQPSHGRDDLNDQIGAFLSRSLELNPVLEKDHISSFAGTRSALEVMGRALFQGYDDRPAGRSVLLPSPRWHGFAWIYEGRLGGSIINIPRTSANGFKVTLDAIKSAYSGSSPRPRALVLIQPDNPLGVNFDGDFLEEVSEWVLKETDMDLVSDEIYAHCQIPGIEAPKFRSVLALPLACEYADRVHVVWGFAKDFGLSGFRVGVLASRSKALHQSMRQVTGAGFSPMTSSNNWFLSKLFKPQRIADDLMKKTLPGKLEESFRAAKGALADLSIPFFEGTHSGQFFWLDLRKWLDRRIPSVTCPEDDPSLEALGDDEREVALERYLRCGDAKVSLLRGQILATEEPGFFRLCFTAVEKEKVVEAIRRISEALTALPE